MAKMTHSSSSWSGTIEQTSPKAKYNLSCGNQFVDKDIIFQINVPGVIIPTPGTGDDPNTFYITIGNVTYNFVVDSSNNVWVSGDKNAPNNLNAMNKEY